MKIVDINQDYCESVFGDYCGFQNKMRMEHRDKNTGASMDSNAFRSNIFYCHTLKQNWVHPVPLDRI